MTIAVYPGTFDPPTNGHLDLIRRAARLFRELYVAVGINTEKKPVFSCDERVELLKQLTSEFDNVVVSYYDGLLVNYARQVGARVIVRGIRTVSDFEYEFQLALMNRSVEPKIETIFVMPAEEFSFVSSTLVKQAVAMGADMTKLIPQIVYDAMKERLGDSRTPPKP